MHQSSGINKGSSRTRAFFKILESNVVPSQPAKTYVNLILKSQAVNTFWVG